MTAASLNRVGLILGMTGVALVFRWGPPQPTFEQGVGVAVEDATLLADGRAAAEHEVEVRQLKRRHAVLSRIGLGLIGVGFLLQLWGDLVVTLQVPLRGSGRRRSDVDGLKRDQRSRVE